MLVMGLETNAVEVTPPLGWRPGLVAAAGNKRVATLSVLKERTWCSRGVGAVMAGIIRNNQRREIG